MKIVFCDIDGVLNSEVVAAQTGVMGIEEDKLSLLQSLTAATGAELVITSKARFLTSMYKERLATIEKAGIRIRDAFAGRTLTANPKAIEVLAYLQNKCGPVESIVILDDNDLGFTDYFKDAFIQIDPRVGLTMENVEKATGLLGNRQD